MEFREAEDVESRGEGRSLDLPDVEVRTVRERGDLFAACAGGAHLIVVRARAGMPAHELSGLVAALPRETTPVVVFVEGASIALRRRCLELGARACLTLPAELEVYRAMVAQLLRGVRSRALDSEAPATLLAARL